MISTRTAPLTVFRGERDALLIRLIGRITLICRMKRIDSKRETGLCLRYIKCHTIMLNSISYDQQASSPCVASGDFSDRNRYRRRGPAASSRGSADDAQRPYAAARQRGAQGDSRCHAFENKGVARFGRGVRRKNDECQRRMGMGAYLAALGGWPVPVRRFFCPVAQR